MSKESPQQRQARESRPVFETALGTAFFRITSIEGNEPDIDGIIRLLDGQGNELEKLLHYQLKSKQEMKKNKYPCDQKTINFLLKTNVPTLLIVVEMQTKKVFWLYLDRETQRKFGLDGTKGRTLDFTGHEIHPDTLRQLSLAWGAVAQRVDHEETKIALQQVQAALMQTATWCVGLLHLLRVIEKERAAAFFADILQIDQQEIATILKKLVESNVVVETQKLYLLQDEKLGRDSAEAVLERIDLQRLVQKVTEKEKLVHLLEQLAVVRHPKAEALLRMFGEEIIEAIQQATTNDEISMRLELLAAFAQQVPTTVLTVARNILGRKTEIPSTTTTFGTWTEVTGKKHKNLLKQVVGLLRQVRYLRAVPVLRILAELLLKVSDADLQKEVQNLVKAMSEYNPHALRFIGLKTQQDILTETEAWSDRKLLKSSTLILQLCRELLDASYELSEMKDHETMTLSWGALMATPALKQVRRRTMKLLLRLFELAPDPAQKIFALKALEEASKTPMRGRYEKDLEELILGDANWLIALYVKLLPHLPVELIKEIDEQKEWFIMRYKRERLPKIHALEQAINGHDEYRFYRFLVGDDHGFSRQMKYGEIRKYRTKKIASFVSGITLDNQEEWTQRILRVAAKSSLEQRGSFNYFRLFLHLLAKQHPKFAEFLLKKHAKELRAFLSPLHAGLAASKSKEAAKRVVREWVRKGKNLPECARAISYLEDVEQQIISSVFMQARRKGDQQALLELLNSLGRKFDGSVIQRKLFLSIIEELKKLGTDQWVNFVWMSGEKVLSILKEREADIILDGLLPVCDVSGGDGEYVLNILANKHPLLVVRYFKQRIMREKGQGVSSLYVAVPFDRMWELREILKPHRKAIIIEILGWYRTKDWLFRHQTSKLLELLFDQEIEPELIALIRSGKEKDAKIVLDILCEWGRGALTSNVTKEFIRQYHSNKRHMNLLQASMSETGVVTGKDGLLHAYEHKRETMREWEKDGNENLRKFALEYGKDLEARIADESERIQEDDELDKRGLR